MTLRKLMLALDRKIQAKHYYGSVEFGGFRFYEKMPTLMHKFINSTRLIRIVARFVCYRFVLCCVLHARKSCAHLYDISSNI